MLEREDRQSEVGEHTRLANKSQGAHRLLHRDLRNGREVEVTVMRHDDSIEQNRHNTRQMTALGEHVGAVSEDQQQRKLERRMLS